MKKIIKAGKPKSKTLKTSCEHCGCIFTYEDSDGKWTMDQRDGDFRSMKCPQAGCGKIVITSE